MEILEKEGWMLNPDEKHVNIITSLIEKNNGKCPCYNQSKDPYCPCSDYKENNICHCKLYIQKEKSKE